MEGVLFFMIVFGSITLWKHMGHRHRERMLELQRGRAASTAESQALQSATEERLRHLESIVCTVDFELNTKLSRLASQRPAALPPTTSVVGTSPRPEPSLADSRVLQSGQRLADRFVIGRVLRSGTAASVYLARDDSLGESVALKVIHGLGLLSTEAVDLLRAEVNAARRIVHPNVVRIRDIGEDSGRMFLSMEFVAGTSLRDLVEKEGPLSLERVSVVVDQICAGLEAAHAQGIIHRDLKPGNVLVTPDRGRLSIKLIDFGLARTTSERGHTSAGMLLGTPQYMAPEQIEGAAADPRTDVYGVGAIAYQCLTGQPPFSGATPIAVSLAVSTGAPRPAAELRSDLPPAWSAVLARALARDPDDRYQTVSALRADVPEGSG